MILGNFLKKKSIKKAMTNNYQSLIEVNNHPIWSNKNYLSFAENGYAKNVIAFRVIRMIASNISSVPIISYYYDSSERFIVKNSPILELINQPNKRMSRAEFFECIISYKLISGNAYILRKIENGEITELTILQPDRVSVLLNKEKEIVGYRYTFEREETDYLIDSIDGSCDILHLKNFNPLDDWYGLSNVETALNSIDQHNQAVSWNQALLQNGARPSGALIVKPNTDGSGGNLSEEQYQRIRNQLDDLYSGAKNSGKPLLLEGGLEWKEMSISPKDMDFINMKDSAARDIALAFGVPPQLLGIPGDSTYNNLAESRLALWEQTIIPMLDDLLCYISSWLNQVFNSNVLLGYEQDSISPLSPRREKIWKFIEDADYMTINEKRKAVGLSAVEGGDILSSLKNEGTNG